jgi:hypothetical protein
VPRIRRSEPRLAAGFSILHRFFPNCLQAAPSLEKSQQAAGRRNAATLQGMRRSRQPAGFPTIHRFFPACLPVAPIIGAEATSCPPLERREDVGNASQPVVGGDTDLGIVDYDGAEAAFFFRSAKDVGSTTMVIGFSSSSS